MYEAFLGLINRRVVREWVPSSMRLDGQNTWKSIMSGRECAGADESACTLSIWLGCWLDSICRASGVRAEAARNFTSFLKLSSCAYGLVPYAIWCMIQNATYGNGRSALRNPEIRTEAVPITYECQSSHFKSLAHPA